MDELLDLLEADGMTCTGVLATHYHPDHVGGQMMGLDIEGVTRVLERISVPIHVQTEDIPYVKAVTGVDNSHIVGCSSGDVLSVGAVEIELIHTTRTHSGQSVLSSG